MEDIHKILHFCEVLGVSLHPSYNQKLLKSIVGNNETENIVFAEIVLIMAELRQSKYISDFLDTDWWYLVQYFRPLAQLFAIVNDVAVLQWNGHLDKVVNKFITYKISVNSLEII